MPEMTSNTAPATSAWKQAVAEHRKPVLRSGLWQLGNSLIPCLALWGLMSDGKRERDPVGASMYSRTED